MKQKEFNLKEIEVLNYKFLHLNKRTLVLYCYLQQISQVDINNQIRFVESENFNKSAIAKMMGITRSTLYKEIERLKESGLLNVEKIDNKGKKISLLYINRTR